jgi:hypothetical protein
MDADNIDITILNVAYTRYPTDGSVPSGSDENYKLVWLLFTSVLPILAPRRRPLRFFLLLLPIGYFCIFARMRS